MTQTLDAPATVTVPSADLINYRFDITDKRFEEMSNKLDTLLLQNTHFLTDEQVKRVVGETVSPIQDRLDSYRWYVRASFSAAILAFLTTLATLVFKGSL